MTKLIEAATMFRFRKNYLKDNAMSSTCIVYRDQSTLLIVGHDSSIFLLIFIILCSNLPGGNLILDLERSHGGLRDGLHALRSERVLPNDALYI